MQPNAVPFVVIYNISIEEAVGIALDSDSGTLVIYKTVALNHALCLAQQHEPAARSPGRPATESARTLAEKDAADALTTAMDLESKAKEARDKAEKLKKSAAEKTHAAKKAAAESEKANKKADDRSRAKAECVRRLVSLEKELKSMEAILSEADTSSPAIVDVSLD